MIQAIKDTKPLLFALMSVITFTALGIVKIVIYREHITLSDFVIGVLVTAIALTVVLVPIFAALNRWVLKEKFSTVDYISSCLFTLIVLSVLNL